MSSINWNNLRPWNGSQLLAFEEICCQLANHEKVPVGSKFIRKGIPDAGVECFWELPDGKEYCWQAKYFLCPPDSNQWSQIDDSVQTALEKHFNMSKYIVCLPIDRPDARIDKQKSCLEKWNDHVRKWTGWAKDKTMSVAFVYWGESEIYQRLSQEEHRGRYLFWFNKDILSHQKIVNQINEAIANVGPRYTPELNIHLELSEVFEYISRTPKYTLKLRKYIGLVQRKLHSLLAKECEDVLQTNVTKIRSLSEKLIDKLRIVTISAIEIVVLEDLSNLLNTLRDLFWDSEAIIHKTKSEEYAAETKNKPEDMPRYHHSEKHDRWIYNMGEAREAIDKLYVFIEGNKAQLAMNPAMVLSGAAGTGKTHLLCDLAKARVDEKQPTVFLLGQNFCDGEPWGQIINQLQLNCQTKEEFLGILNAAGQASGARALILIDAINESGSKEIWRNNLAGMLEAVKRYPWVGIVLSVRDSYFNYMIPQGLAEQGQLIAVPHKGFAGVEYKAAKEFFRYYNIKQPDVPLLNPEFQNPLFLKLLCCSLKNSEITEFPRGSQNITKVYEDFIESVNKKLSAQNILDYDPSEKIVWKAVEQLASKMGERYDSRIPLAEAKQIVQDILPSNGYHNSLFYYLETEGIITKCVLYTEESYDGEAVQFAYERFADHLIVKYLLDNYLNLDTPELSFADNQPLAFLFDRERFWHYEGLIDALSIQLPERIGKELIELIPKRANRDSIQQGFLDSLIWRTTESITEKATEIINQHILQHKDGYEQLMETFITVAGIVGHPYNADKLHKWLLKQNLPKRDATWSIFLFDQIEENGAVDRLIDWAWSCEDKSHIGDESILLLAKTLAWFLTTSQRYLRDRATKAMVNLLTDRIHLLSSLLEEFKDVNDPYVAERLYAVAYGCAMRTTEKNKICDLANYIYENIFKDGTPPVHVLLRDYARGVIELAVHYGLKTNACLKKIRPPYKSTWPNDIPSKDELENLYSYDAEKKGVETNEHLRRLYNHIASSDFSDFNRYIIEHGCYNWTSRRKGEPKKVTNKDRYNSFVESLTSKQKKAWDEVNERCSSAIRIVVSDSDNKQISEIKPSSDAENLLEEAENDFIKTLGEKKRIRYFEFVIPYLNRELPQDEYELFDKSLAESFILKRVLDLGWSPKLHAEFDDNRHDMWRRANKPERIGKKYQWIAYHELLALISDHFEYKEDLWSGDKNYEGPWQSYIRDIDPSYVLPGNKQEYWATSHSTTWWFPIMYNAWDEEPDDSVWLQKDNDLPLIKKMIEVSDDNGSKWLCLESHYNLREPIQPEEEPYEKEKREFWYMINSYLVKKTDMRTLYGWAQKQDFFGNWMPESHATTGIFLGEYYWSPAFRFHDQPYYYHEGWTKGREDGRYELPVPVLVSNDGYLQEDGCYDCSINNTVNISLPAKTLVEEMQLSWNGYEGEWYDCDDNLIAFDPSVRQKGPGCLLLEKEAFLKYLDKMGYDVLWTILGEKRMIGGAMHHGDWKGRLIINGVAKLEAGEVVTRISQNYQSA